MFEEDLDVRIWNIRKALNLKQYEIAPMVNKSRPAYNQMEGGKYEPTFETISKYASDLNVNLYYLMFGEGAMFIEPAFADSLNTFTKNAVDDDEVRDFFYQFVSSKLVQKFILSQYKDFMLQNKDKVLRQTKKAEKPSKGGSKKKR